MIIEPNTQAVYIIRAHGADLYDDDNVNPWSYENVRGIGDAKMYDIYKVGGSRDLAKRWKQYEAYGYLPHQMAYLRTGHLTKDPMNSSYQWENALRHYVKIFADGCYARREWFAVGMCDQDGDGSRYYALADFWRSIKYLCGDRYDDFEKGYWKYHWKENRHLTKGYTKRHLAYKNRDDL